MDAEGDRSVQNDDQREPPRRAPLQFRLRTMFVITAVLGLLLATLRWLGVPPLASFFVLAVLAVSVLAAVGLVVVIAGSVTGEEDDEP